MTALSTATAFSWKYTLFANARSYLSNNRLLIYLENMAGVYLWLWDMACRFSWSAHITLCNYNTSPWNYSCQTIVVLVFPLYFTGHTSPGTAINLSRRPDPFEIRSIATTSSLVSKWTWPVAPDALTTYSAHSPISDCTHSHWDCWI